jgi:CIC family chloride channel protein
MNERPQDTRKPINVSLAAALVGVSVGLVAGAFRLVTEQLANLLGSLSSAVAGWGVLAWGVPTLAVAVMAAAALWLVQHFAPESGGSGVQEIEGALSERRPLDWRRVLPTKFVGATMALGSGMVLGREGPTIHMGGGIGAMLSEFFGHSKAARHVSIAAGAAAGLSAAFNAPLSGVIFVVEEMRPQFRFGYLSFQALLIASVCADVVTRVGFGQQHTIRTADFVAPDLTSLPLFLVYGALLGVVAVVFSRSIIAVLNQADRLSLRGRLVAAGLVGAGIGLVGIFDADLVGGGYGAIHTALFEHKTIGALIFIFGIRFVLTLASYGSGVPGGIFAPMLALGVLLGVVFDLGITEVLPGLGTSPGIFAIAGMAGFFSATVRAPLTAIALTIEMTGNLDLMLPLLITCLAATSAAEALGSRPIYEVLLERTLLRDGKKEAG